MDENAVKGMIVSYFLSREGQFAYDYLGYGTQKATHVAVGEVLGLKDTTVKNTRDQFDSVTESHRVGWYQRPLPPSRARVAEQYGAVSRDALAALVGRFLGRELPSLSVSVPQGFAAVLDVVEDAEPVDGTPAAARAETGRLAEMAFEAFFETTLRPVRGKLIDCRDQGAGYDYRIETDSLPHFVEVKGLGGAEGGISMTAKEWLTARSYSERYHLALVLNVRGDPDVRLCADPGRKLVPTLRFSHVVQEHWTVGARAILMVAS